MADRGIFRLPNHPVPILDGLAWIAHLKGWRPSHTNTHATAFGQQITALQPGSEALAIAMYSGSFNFGGETIKTSLPQLFKQKQSTASWQAAMQTLAWLQHFAASGRNLHAHYAMRLLELWNKIGNPKRDIQSQCAIVFALARDMPTIARCVGKSEQAELFSIVSRAVRNLTHTSPQNPHNSVLKAAALLYAVTAFRGFEPLRKTALELSNSHIDTLILPDGGHSSGHPAEVLNLLEILLPLRHAMRADRQIFPDCLESAAQRMFGFLHMLRHDDGGLTKLRGGQTDIERMNAVLTHDEFSASPVNFAAASHFARLHKGKTIALVDTSESFAFELSDGVQRLFRSHTEMRTFTNQASLNEIPQGTLLQLEANDTRQRTYFLANSGTDFRIEDRYHQPIEIVLNLHHEVKILAKREGYSLTLVGPDRTVWDLNLRGAESLVEQNGAVIRMLSTGDGVINWALKKQTKSPKPSARKSKPEPGLLT